MSQNAGVSSKARFSSVSWRWHSTSSAGPRSGLDRLADAPQRPARVRALGDEVAPGRDDPRRVAARPRAMSANCTCIGVGAELRAQQGDLLGAHDHERRLAGCEPVPDEGGCAVEELVPPGIQECLVTKAGVHVVSVHGVRVQDAVLHRQLDTRSRPSAEHVKSRSLAGSTVVGAALTRRPGQRSAWMSATGCCATPAWRPTWPSQLGARAARSEARHRDPLRPVLPTHARQPVLPCWEHGPPRAQSSPRWARVPYPQSPPCDRRWTACTRRAAPYPAYREGLGLARKSVQPSGVGG